MAHRSGSIDDRRRLVIGVLALTLVAAACAPSPPPGPAQRRTVAGSWGSGLEPHAVAVPYGAHPRQVADLHLHTAGTHRGTIVFVHGGGFTRGSRVELIAGDFGALLLQTRRGYDVVAIDYRLAPASPFPAARDDVASALRWVYERGPEHGLARGPVIVVGHSAGGALAAMVGTTPGAGTAAGPVPRVAGWVSIAGLSTFEHRGMIEDFPHQWGLRSTAERRAASPLSTLDRSDPPGHLIHGDRDAIVRDVHSTDLWVRAVETGSTVSYDWVHRGPEQCRRHLPMCGADMDAFERFLDRAATTGPASR